MCCRIMSKGKVQSETTISATTQVNSDAEINMIQSRGFKFITCFRSLLNARFCSNRPPPPDTNAPFRIKPQHIPKGIWSEETDTKFTSVEEIKDHWHYVERLFPNLRIPDPPKKISSIGWKAPSDEIPNSPYFIKRSRNHMLPVYETRIFKDKILVTKVGRIHGDIWQFEYDLKTYLEEKLGEKVESHVSEIQCKIHVKGNHVETIKEWLYNKGF